jgi:gamma-glutamylaminecyclotransferase
MVDVRLPPDFSDASGEASKEAGDSRVLLFVYGTLRRGEEYHHYLARSTGRGLARTEAHFTLLSLGTYPALVDGGSTAVVGELYLVDLRDLAAIDELEECPELYIRVIIPLSDGRRVHTYLLAKDVDPNWQAIPSGDWLQRG